MKNFYNYKIKGREFTLAEEDGRLTDLHFGYQKIDDAVKVETEILQKTAVELEEYFAGQRKAFDIPLAPKGTVFQEKVWQTLTTIPYGETRSYKETAVLAGSPKGCRAAGMANNRNPIAIIIPCHRVIGMDGKLVGYGGGLELKKELLALEQKYKS